MSKKQAIQKELEDISPFLAEIKKGKQAFQVPEDYFHKMQNEVLDQIKHNSSSAAPSQTFFQKIITDSIRTIQLLIQPRYIIQVATFALLIAAGIYFLKPESNISPNDKTSSVFLADVSIEEINEYIEANIDDFELEELIDMAAIETDDFYDATESIQTTDQELDEYIDGIIDEFDIEELEDIL